MLLENIPLGRTLEIFVDRDEYRYRLVSKVEDVNEFRVCVTAITSNGRFFQFHPTDRIRLVYRDSEIMWEWDHVQAGIAKLDNYPVHYLQIRDKGRSFNRRESYRLQILEYVVVQYYEVPGKENTVSDIPDVSVSDMDHMSPEQKSLIMEMIVPKEEKCMIKDLSEGGLGLYSDKKFKIGDEIFMDVQTSYGLLPIKAQIVREADVKSKDVHYMYHFGCELTQADQRLIRYIYELQRKILKKKRFEKEEKAEWEKNRLEKTKEKKKWRKRKEKEQAK